MEENQGKMKKNKKQVLLKEQEIIELYEKHDLKEEALEFLKKMENEKKILHNSKGGLENEQN